MSNFNYHNKKFKPLQLTDNSEIGNDMVFHYQQDGSILSCSYQSKNILKGHLMGIVDDQGRIEMRYHQINQNGELMTGICNSVPEILDDGRIRLHESWQWTSGDLSKGQSVLEEIR